MTQGELDDFTTMITGSDDVVNYELFLQEVRSELNTGVSVESSTWNELKREFSFYDYSNEGFIDLDSAKMLVNHFSEHFTVNQWLLFNNL